MKFNDPSRKGRERDWETWAGGFSAGAGLAASTALQLLHTGSSALDGNPCISRPRSPSYFLVVLNSSI